MGEKYKDSIKMPEKIERVNKVLKPFSKLDISRKEDHGTYGWHCEITGGFINDDMVDLFDGITLREFINDEHLYMMSEDNPYGWRHGSWSFNEYWFVDDYEGWLAEEDFAL